MGEPYQQELLAGGYEVRQATNFVDVLSSGWAVPDIVVLCDLAVLAYPRQDARVLRVSSSMTPQALVAEVHRRVALRATLQAMIGQAA